MRERPIVLVVDDEDDLRLILREVLEAREYDVREARDGEEALAYLAAHEVDLVILDLIMPGLGGREVLSRLDKSRRFPVVALTALGSTETAVECMRLGADDFLAKPFLIDTLVSKAEAALRARPAEPRPRGADRTRMLSMTGALSRSRDARILVREFLTQLRENFTPDAAFLLLDGSLLGGKDLNVRAGRLLRGRSSLDACLARVAKRSMAGESLAPLRFESPKICDLLRCQADRRCPPLSILAAPLGAGERRIGAVVLARLAEEGRYSLAEQQILAVFTAHAASAIEGVQASAKLDSLGVGIVKSFASAVEAKDHYTRGHSERVGNYAVRLGMALGLTDRELRILKAAGVLHDVGKIGIPDNVLNKPGPLTKEEFDLVRGHPTVGRDILSRLFLLKDLLPVIYHHHERVDGAGYPDGLSGSRIPFLARVLAVADSFEAMTSARSYKAALAPRQAAVLLRQGADSQWDAEIVEMWLRTARSLAFC